MAFFSSRTGDSLSAAASSNYISFEFVIQRSPVGSDYVINFLHALLMR